VSEEIRGLEKEKRDLEAQVRASQDVSELQRELATVEAEIDSQRDDELRKLQESFDRLRLTRQ